MRKWLVVAVALLVAAGAALLALRNLGTGLNARRDWLAQQAEARLGRAVTFGRIGVSLRDGLAAEVHDLRIGDDPAFAGDDFLRVDRARVRIKLLPALLGRYEVRRVELEAPRVVVIRDGGRFNFESVARSTGSAPHSTSGSGEAPAESAARIAALPLLVGELAIRDASIHFVDRDSNPPRRLELEHVDLEGSGLDTTDRIRLAADASRTAIDHPSLRKPGGVPLTIGVEAARRDDRIDVGRLTAKLAGIDVSGKGRFELAAGGENDLELTVAPAPLADFAALLPTLSDLSLSGSIAAHLQATGKRGEAPDVQGKIELATVAAQSKGRGWKLAAPGAIVTLANGSAVLPPTELTVAGFPVRIEAKIEKLSQPAVELKAHAAELRPAALFPELGRQAGEIVLNDAALDGGVSLAPQAPGWLVSFTSPNGKIRDLEYRNLRIAASLQGATILLRRLQIESGDGSMVARGGYDTSREPPALDVHATIRDVELQPLLAAAGHDGGPSLRGRLQAQLDLRGAGKSRSSLVASLNGNGNVRIADGAIDDFNIAEGVLSGITGVSGLTDLVSPRVRQRRPEVFSTRSTRFDSLTATLEIAAQRVTTSDLLLVAPEYTVRGTGVFGFDRRLDMNGRFLASEKLSADLLADVREARLALNDQGRLEVPFQLEGKLPHLRLKPDSRFLTNTLQKAIGEGLEHLLQPKKKRGKDGSSGDSLRKRLKKLFGD
jgi:uncharacterized protein involved in outer membrane biogenesis